MQALGIDVLFKGINMQHLLGGLWISLRISLIAVAFSIVMGLVRGALISIPKHQLFCRPSWCRSGAAKKWRRKRYKKSACTKSVHALFAMLIRHTFSILEIPVYPSKGTTCVTASLGWILHSPLSRSISTYLSLPMPSSFM